MIRGSVMALLGAASVFEVAATTPPCPIIVDGSCAFLPSGLGMHTAVYDGGSTQLNAFPDFDSSDAVAEWTSKVDFGRWPASTPENFASRHTGYLTVLVAGDYKFALAGALGSRLFIDGQQVGETWSAYYTPETVFLSPGQYEVRIEYFAGETWRGLTFLWAPPGDLRPWGVPLERLSPLPCPTVDSNGKCIAPSPSGSGLLEQVFRVDDAVLGTDYPTYDPSDLYDHRIRQLISVRNNDRLGLAFRFTMTLTITKAGVYSFSLADVPRSRMLIDGVLVVVNGGVGAVYLLAGQYEVRVDFVQELPGQYLDWKWQEPGRPAWMWVPGARLEPLACPAIDDAGRCTVPPLSGVGIRRQVYYQSFTPANPWYSFFTSFPDFDTMTPRTNGVVSDVQQEMSNSDYVKFAARWSGSLTVTQAASYTFDLGSATSSRMFIDGVLLDFNQGTGSVYLLVGQHEVRVEFFQSDFEQTMRLSWQQSGASSQQVPQERLNPLVCSTVDEAGRCEGTADPPLPRTPQPAPSPSPEEAVFFVGEGLRTFIYQTGSPMLDFPDYANLDPVVKSTSDTVNFEDHNAWLVFGDFDDDFASRHFGYLIIDVADTYTFYLSSDDGSRMFLDGEPRIDNGGIHGQRVMSAMLPLSAGSYALELQYFEHTDGSVLKFEWSSPRISRATVPKANLRVSVEGVAPALYITPLPPPSSPATVSGLITSVYKTGNEIRDFPIYEDLTPVVTVTTDTINFGDHNAWLALGDFHDNFASRHFGYLIIDVSDTYTFYITSDDGSRLSINHRLLIDNSGLHGRHTEEADIYLPAGSHPIELEYFDHTYGSIMIFEWSPRGQNRVVVPKENLRVSL